MALSDLIRKIEDSPGSTKVAVVASGIAVAAVGVAVFAVLNQSDSNPEPSSPVVRVANAAPTATSVPSPMPRPTPVPTSTPAPTAIPQPTATPLPTETPLPTATPDVSDYFVILHTGKYLRDGFGVITYYASYPFAKNVRGIVNYFEEDDFYLEYLSKEGVITSEQKNAYFNGEDIKIPLVPISTAHYKLFQRNPHKENQVSSGLLNQDYLFHYADKSAVDSDGGGSGFSLAGDGGYVSISDGKITVSAVDADGNATTVDLEGVGAQELLDYWLSENKITIEQRNEYGETGQLEFSLKDGVDLFDFDYSSDVEFYTGMDKEAQDMIINEILPLFAGD